MTGCDEFTEDDHSETIEALLAPLRLHLKHRLARFDFSRN
jgi:hypothetical protein